MVRVLRVEAARWRLSILSPQDIKKQVFAQLSEHCKPDATLCTNTSTLDIDEVPLSRLLG